MRIRIARAADVPAILEIYRPYIEETAISFEYSAPPLQAFRERFAAVTAKCPWLVCENGDEIMGYAYGAPAFERTAYRWVGDLSVYLRRDARGRGLGRALYEVLEAMMAAQGYQAVYAIVTTANGASIRFHRALGYAEIGMFSDCGFKAGKWYGVTWLEKRLCPVHVPEAEPTAAPEMDWSGLKFPALRGAGWTVELMNEESERK